VQIVYAISTLTPLQIPLAVTSHDVADEDISRLLYDSLRHLERTTTLVFNGIRDRVRSWARLHIALFFIGFFVKAVQVIGCVFTPRSLDLDVFSNKSFSRFGGAGI